MGFIQKMLEVGRLEFRGRMIHEIEAEIASTARSLNAARIRVRVSGTRTTATREGPTEHTQGRTATPTQRRLRGNVAKAASRAVHQVHLDLIPRLRHDRKERDAYQMLDACTARCQFNYDGM